MAAERAIRESDDGPDQVLAAYLAGDLVRDIASRIGVNRTTVIGHVTRRRLPRRSDHRG